MHLNVDKLGEITAGFMNDLTDSHSSKFAYSNNNVLESAILSRMIVDAFMTLYGDALDEHEHVSVHFSDASGNRTINISNRATDTLGGIVYSLQKI